jgi:predicted TIM-barrel fold metal-dependent hydrolase
MYAADHIRRVLETFPGVFSGIGEFTIHKEFVSSKVAGEIATLNDPALDRIFDFAGEVGLVVILHNDINMPFPKPDQEPYMLAQLKALFERHPQTTIIWAHMGLGRIVAPMEAMGHLIEPGVPRDQIGIIDRALTNPKLKHVHIDLSWDEVAKYLQATPESLRRTIDLVSRHPDRFLFGTDVVAPSKLENMMAVYQAFGPLWDGLAPDVREKVLKGNYERLFDEARRRVRAWEKANVK